MAKSSGNGDLRRQRDEYIKPTQAEHRERLNATIELWARHRTPSQIRQALRDKWGMSKTAADRYIRVARDRCVQFSSVPPQEMVAKSYATYVRRIAAAEKKLLDESLDPVDHARYARIVIDAQKCIDDLFSLQKAKKVALTTVEGDDVLEAVVKELSQEQLLVLSLIGERLEEAERSRPRLPGSNGDG